MTVLLHRINQSCLIDNVNVMVKILNTSMKCNGMHNMYRVTIVLTFMAFDFLKLYNTPRSFVDKADKITRSIISAVI